MILHACLRSLKSDCIFLPDLLLCVLHYTTLLYSACSINGCCWRSYSNGNTLFLDHPDSQYPCVVCLFPLCIIRILYYVSLVLLVFCRPVIAPGCFRQSHGLLNLWKTKTSQRSPFRRWHPSIVWLCIVLQHSSDWSTTWTPVANALWSPSPQAQLCRQRALSSLLLNWEFLRAKELSFYDDQKVSLLQVTLQSPLNWHKMPLQRPARFGPSGNERQTTKWSELEFSTVRVLSSLPLVLLAKKGRREAREMVAPRERTPQKGRKQGSHCFWMMKKYFLKVLVYFSYLELFAHDSLAFISSLSVNCGFAPDMFSSSQYRVNVWICTQMQLLPTPWAQVVHSDQHSLQMRTEHNAATQGHLPKFITIDENGTVFWPMTSCPWALQQNGCLTPG